jgi:energy-coupling factor transport system ATP-binding protein
MEEAAVADRILIIDRGKAVMDGAPKEIFSQKEKLKELGLDIPMAVRMAGRLRAQGIDVPEELVAESDLIDFLSEMIA